MNSFLQHILIIALPLVASNILHMLVVKNRWFSALNIPVSTSLFGENKTWRGFLFLTLCNGVLLYLFNSLFTWTIALSFELGAILGFSYLLFELPNSYMKRKIGLKPGAQHKRYKYFFSWIDKSDSAIGLCLVYFLLGYISGKEAFLLYLALSITHIVMSKLLVYLKIKKSF